MEGVVPNTEELLRNLKHQLSLYKQLLDQLREEKQYIIEIKYKELRDVTFSKEALIDEIQREEFRRQVWIKSACKLIGIGEKEITLEIVANRLAREQFESIMSLRNALQMLIRKTKELNEENKKLVEVALKDTQELKRSILGLSSDQPKVYGPKGQMNQKENTARILNKKG